MMLIINIGGRFKVWVGVAYNKKNSQIFNAYIMSIFAPKSPTLFSPTLHTHNPVSTPMLIFELF